MTPPPDRTDRITVTVVTPNSRLSLYAVSADVIPEIVRDLQRNWPGHVIQVETRKREQSADSIVLSPSDRPTPPTEP